MAKKKAAPANIIERAISNISPTWALKRHKARMMLSMTGGYTAGSRHRPALANFNPAAGDANSDIGYDAPLIRARSRDLARNAPVACGAVNGMVTNVVGTGLTYQSRIDAKFLKLTEAQAEAFQEAAEREFELFAESTDCDVTGTQNLYGLQDLAFRSMLESGDVFARFVKPWNSPTYPLALELIEADRVGNPGHGTNNARLVDGVILNDSGAATAYHICKTHPGAALYSRSLEYIETPAYDQQKRRLVLHLFDRRRPGQHRGIPYLAPVIESIKQIDRFSEAELSAAVNNAVFAMFIKMDAEAFGDLFNDNERSAYFGAASNWDGKIKQADLGEAGQVVNLLPGEEVVSPNSDRPNINFDPFFLAMMTQIGTALELPREVLLKVFNSSYSAARASLLDAWRTFRKRRDFMATYFCQPVLERWMDFAVAMGRLNAPGYFADPAIRRAYQKAAWVGDGPGAIDPMKDVQAAEKRYTLGITTLEHESVMFDGVPWKTKHAQQAKERRLRKAAGLDKEPVAERIATEPTSPQEAEEIQAETE